MLDGKSSLDRTKNVHCTLVNKKEKEMFILNKKRTIRVRFLLAYDISIILSNYKKTLETTMVTRNWGKRNIIKVLKNIYIFYIE